MEAYDEANSSCVTGVLTFLDAWDRQLVASGYVSGVYSSAASGVTDLQTTTTIAGHPLAEPQAIWIALWDNALNVTGSPYVTSAVWPTSARSKQYAGPHGGKHRRVLRGHRLRSGGRPGGTGVTVPHPAVPPIQFAINAQCS